MSLPQIQSTQENEATEALRQELRPESGAVLWPRCPRDIPDDSPCFRIAYLRPEDARLDEPALIARLNELHRLWGQTRRQFRNGLGFAVMDLAGADRFAREKSIANFRAAYRRIYLPEDGRSSWGETRFVRVDFACGETSALHDSAMQALGEKIRSEISAEEFASWIGLERVDCSGIVRSLFPMADAGSWFFRFLGFPRFRDLSPLRTAILGGIREGRFGILRSNKLLRLDKAYEEIRTEVLTGAGADESAVVFERGYYLAAIPAAEERSR